MGRSKTEDRTKKEFNNAFLRYTLTEDPQDARRNAESYPKFREALLAEGIHLEIKDGQMTLYLKPEEYVRKRTRYAGIKKKQAENPEAASNGEMTAYRFSDITFMLNSMKDSEIMEKIGMPYATYYRHKKAMKESNYYRLLEPDKTNDRAYLESLPFNLAF